jgi:SAM-dependent methyltransferase
MTQSEGNAEANVDILTAVARYYSDKIAAHGPTPAGADWKNEESQILRFRQLLRLLKDDPTPPATPSLLDFGCGYGALASLLAREGFASQYLGYDLSAPMIAAAQAGQQGLASAASYQFDTDLAKLTAAGPADYTLASGIFNVKMGIAADRWLDYIHSSIAQMAALSRRGFAFNVLTGYADREKMRPDLYYADPLALFAYCRQFSRAVALLHDYPLYEFTILVRLAY